MATTKKGKRPSAGRKSQLKRPQARASATGTRASAPRFQRRRVVVRFHDHFNEAQERKELTEQYGVIAFHPVFIVARAVIGRLQSVARARNPRYALPDFLNYYFLRLRAGREPADVVRELRKRRTVAFAYVDEPTRNAASSPSQLKCNQSSGHIDGQGVGVDARSAWTFPGGKGDGQFFVDVEHGWTKEHIRLPTSRIKLLVGESQFGERAHGTSVLGIVCGQHSQAGGCEGLAPNVAHVGLASPASGIVAPASLPAALRYVAATGGVQNVYDAIAIGIHELYKRHESSPQDGYGVLLLEQQTAQGLPVETYEGVQALIALATQTFGITVVEAAGNAGEDLDIHPDAQVLNERDSGAILVGSANSVRIGRPASGHHTRFPSSNFGRRVNCYAWGERVLTPAWRSGKSGPPGVLDECNDLFGHTSAAAAIIAGVALIVQGIVAHRGHQPQDANQLRTTLANPAYGTPGAPGHKIGVMPDLAKIAPGV